MLTVGQQIVVQHLGLIGVYLGLTAAAAQLVADVDQGLQAGGVDADHLILAHMDVIALQQVLHRLVIGLHRQQLVAVTDQHHLPGGQDDLGVAAGIIVHPQSVALIGEIGIAVHQSGGLVGDHQIGIGLGGGVRHAPGQEGQHREAAQHQPAHPHMGLQLGREAAQELILRQLPHGLFRPLPPGLDGAYHAGVQEPGPQQTPDQCEHVAQTPPEHPECPLQGPDLVHLAEDTEVVPHAAPGELDVGPKLLQSFFHNTSMISILPPR